MDAGSCLPWRGIRRHTGCTSANAATRQTRAGAIKPPSNYRITALEDGRLGVGAPDVLECLDDLALGRVRPRRLDERRQQVAGVVGRALAHGLQRLLDGPGVAPGAHGLQPVDLLALERRVDPQ